MLIFTNDKVRSNYGFNNNKPYPRGQTRAKGPGKDERYAPDGVGDATIEHHVSTRPGPWSTGYYTQITRQCAKRKQIPLENSIFVRFKVTPYFKKLFDRVSFL